MVCERGWFVQAGMPLIAKSFAGSDIIYLHLPKQAAIVVGSLKVATDLLDKRSQLYSDRTKSVVYAMCVDLLAA